MASQGPLSPNTTATGAATASGYGASITNPDNMKVSDNIYASANTVINYFAYQATNFGFSIPSGATINGILVEVEKISLYGGSNYISDSNPCKLVKSNGTLGTTDKSTNANWPLSESYVSYGGASDLWGDSWTADDINSSNFGFFGSFSSYEGDARIDHIRITVYYTVATQPSYPYPTRRQINLRPRAFAPGIAR